MAMFSALCGLVRNKTIIGLKSHRQNEINEFKKLEIRL